MEEITNNNTITKVTVTETKTEETKTEATTETKTEKTKTETHETVTEKNDNNKTNNSKKKNTGNEKTDSKEKERPGYGYEQQHKKIVEQQLAVMEIMKARIEKFGYLLNPEDLAYLAEKVEESYKKCKIYLEMEKKIEEAGLEPKKFTPQFTPPKHTIPYTPPKPKKKEPEAEQISLLDMINEPTDEPKPEKN